MKGICLIVIASCLIPRLACAGETPFLIDVGHPPPRYRLLITDNPSQLRFDLILVSHDDREICISYGGWPDDAGHVDWGSQWVKVTSGNRSFPARDWNFGVCYGDDCTIHVPPRGKLKGFIGYAEFGAPTEIAKLLNRRLHFVTTPYLCELNRKIRRAK